MLTELTIEDFGLVESAKLQFRPGLNVITGETGAGKSLLLNALKLLTGGRSDARMVRLESEKAVIDGIWEVAGSSLREIQEKGLATEGEIFVSRSVQSDGKSRLLLDGRPTPTSYMSELAENLVEIHGQSDQLKLKDTDIQRELLDAFGGSKLAKLLASYSICYGDWNALRKKLKELHENAGRFEIELRYNESLVKRFDELDPQNDELETVQREIEKLAHLEDIAEGLRDILALLLPEETDGPCSLIEQAISSIHKLSKYDEQLSELAEQLELGLKSLDPAISELEDYGNNIDLDSLHRLKELEDRLLELKLFAKPFGGDLNRAIEESLKAQEFLAENSGDLDFEALEEELATLAENLKAKAEEVTTARTAAAKKLSLAINKELEGLAMRGTEFVVQLTPRNPASHGADLVEFMVETKGKNRRPITKAASGGELSRIMLALELVTAAGSAPGTIIFDEIDSGVGGATAIEIGRRLAQLGDTHQVIVVSHLPQVASWAQCHYVISKNEQGTRTDVKEVSDEARVREIARMLSGLSDSDTALAHAQELLSSSVVA